MSFDRIWQYPFELNFPDYSRGIQTQGWGLDRMTVTDDDPFTGDESIYDAGTDRMFTGHGWSPGLDDFRMNMAWKSGGALNNTPYIWAAYVAGNGASNTPDIDVLWHQNELTFQLRVSGVIVDEVSMVQWPHATPYMKNYNSIGVHYLGGTSFDMWFNGQQVFNYVDAGVPSDVEFVGSAWCSASGWVRIQIDDWYFDECAAEASVIPPTYRFLYSNTNADGTSQDWASKNGGNDYEEVDDAEIDDDDTYVWIGSSGSLEMFNTANITLLDGHSIVAAIPVAVARKGTAILASQLQMAVDNGVDAIDYSTAKDLNTWYYETWGRYPLDPAGAGWTESTFNSNEFGMRTQGTV